MRCGHSNYEINSFIAQLRREKVYHEIHIELKHFEDSFICVQV